MNKIFIPILLKIFVLLLFFIIYWVCNDQLTKPTNENTNVIDYFMLSTTIEAGVGVTNLSPKTNFMKIIFTLHQILMICSYLFLFYFFGYSDKDDS
jgi:hypothetical protein